MIQARPDLIGRSDEKAQLARLLAQTKQAQGQVILLTGESGIGKTALLSYLQGIARDNAYTIVRGECVEQDQNFPYAPIIDSLRTQFSAMSPGEFLQIIQPFQHELVKLLPEISYMLDTSSTSTPLEPEAERRRLFEIMLQVYQRLASKGLLLIFEDIHWADSNSIEFFRTLMRRISRLPIMLAMSSRPARLESEVASFQHYMERSPNAQVLPLKALSRERLEELTRAVLQSTAPVHPHLLNTLETLSQGNPLYAEQIVFMLQQNRQISLVNDSWMVTSASRNVDIPSSITQTILLQLSQLDESSQQLLQYAALIGREFTQVALEEISGTNGAQLTDTLKRLIRLRFLEEVARDRFGFRHVVLRQAIYDSMLIRERQTLHAKLLQHFEQLDRSSPARLADLSYHAYQSEAWEAALGYGIQAGEYALSLHSPHAAVEHFNRAIEAAQNLQRADIADLYLQRGTTFNSLGKFDSAEEDFNKALRKSEEQGDHERMWNTLIALARLWTARDYEKVRVYGERALSLARDMNKPGAIAHSLNRLGNWYLNTGKFDAAHQHYEEALKIFSDIDDLLGKAETYELIGMLVSISLDPSTEYYYQSAIQLYRQLDRRQTLAYTLANLGLSSSNLDLVDEAMEIAKQIGHYSAEAYACICKGNILSTRGDYGNAIDFTERGVQLAQAINHKEWLAAGLLRLGLIYLSLNALDKARHYEQVGFAQAQEANSYWFTERAIGLKASILIAEGRLDEAEQYLRAYSLPDIPVLQQFQLLSAVVELELAQGKSSTGLKTVDLAEQMLRGIQNTDFGAIYACYLAPAAARACLLNDQTEKARRLLELVAPLAERTGLLASLWHIHALLGQIWSRGDHDKSEQHYQKARTIIQQISATIPDELREGFLTLAGQSLPGLKKRSDESAPPHDLTRREVDIVREIAHGKTNQQIADDLHITIKTVEAHITRILSKLALESRTQIALWAVDAGFS